ncbi:hypothetical protein T281_15140 [Rhodomicrobium udaipurense JA643]|nr:hypothetical protein T281_15140 [Rhodomicrobium udaipurense JA643]
MLSVQQMLKRGMLYRDWTIIPRKRKDGSIAHMAQIVIKREGGFVYLYRREPEGDRAYEGASAERDQRV